MKENLINSLKIGLKNCELIKANKDLIIANVNNDIDFFEIDGLVNFSDTNTFNTYIALCANAHLFAIDAYDICYLNLSDKDHKLYKDDECITVLQYLADKFIAEEYQGKYKNLSYRFPVINPLQDHMWINEYRWKYVDFLIKNISEILNALES